MPERNESRNMVSTETQLMDLFRECGFDFASTVRDLAARFPVQTEWGIPSHKVLPFGLRRSFAGLGDVWKIPVNRELEFDLPPTQYHHEFHPSGDARANFDRALAQLSALLGEGRPGQSTNVFERDWRFGFFKIRLITWPRERNSHLPNVREGKDPYLWIAANTYIEPDFPFVHPSEDAGEPMQTLLVPFTGCKLVCHSAVYARRNRVLAATATMAAGLVPGAFLVRGADRTVRVPLDQIEKATLTRLTPGRFSGSSSLSVNTVFLGRHQVAVPIAHGEETHTLDGVAETLAHAVAKPLAVEEYPDDG